MPEHDFMHDASIVALDDDRPIAARRKRRGSTAPNVQRDSQPSNERTSTRTYGIATPPATPQRTKKRVRFSEPGPSSTGLTPFLQRSSFSSPPPSKSLRHSTPSTRWNLSVDDSPISGTLQFAPLRQVLEGRVKRRLRRNRLSEELNIIELDERNEKKSRKTEIQRLKEELRRKDHEIQCMKDEQDIAGQIGVEAGIEACSTSRTNDKIRDLELQIAKLRAELQRHELDAPTQDDPNWTMAALDPFNNDNTFMPSYDDEFNAEMTDVFLSTPVRGSFPSPPATMPNTPSKPASVVDLSGKSPSSDPERLHLESQFKTLQDELHTLSRTLELNNTTHERLTAKLSPFISTSAQCEENEILDAALDTVLTQLALSQSTALDSSNRFSALASELAALFSPSSSSPDPESILQLLHTQFRAARLELEYLTPGENPEGFENSKLLDMLVSRLRVLSKKVSEQDLDIDQYHSQEISLRQQLGSRIDAMDALQTSLTIACSEKSRLEADLRERDESISKLTQALQGYRDEVRGLETLITRLEVEHAADVAILRNEIENATKSAESKLLDSELKRETLQAAADGREMLMLELEQRLSAALASTQTLKDEIARMAKEKSSVVTLLQESALERERKHGDALALRDARVSELREEVERINASLKEAHTSIMDLKREKRDLAAQVEGEKVRGKAAIDAMRGQMAGAMETGMGYLNGDVAVRGSISGGEKETAEVGSSSAIQTPMTSQTVVKPGRYLDGGLARKQGSQQGKKRRRYDSGLGFLEEEDDVLENLV